MDSENGLSHATVLAYEELACYTAGLCDRTCGKRYDEAKLLSNRRCCNEGHCGIAAENAAKVGITLNRVGDDRTPYLGPDGKCTVAPFLRPLCSVHLCALDKLPKEDQTRYFDLRAKCAELDTRELE